MKTENIRIEELRSGDDLENDAQSALERVWHPWIRDLPEWEPKVGHRSLALAKLQQTGEYPMPPKV